jgi:hypothetical protein
MAKMLLERSLVRPEGPPPHADPMSSMVAAADAGRGLMFRVGAPAIIVTTFSALLAWGYTGQSATEPRIPNNALPVAASQAQWTPASWRDKSTAPTGGATEARENPKPVEQLTLQQARKIAARFAKGTVGDLEIVDTDSGPAIVAVSNQRKAGTTNYLLLQKRDGKFRVSAQGRLDTQGFSHANWNAELVDADEDGFQEMLFTGKDSSEGRNLRRLILFVPNDKRTYSAQMTGETTPRGTPRIQWLSNAAGADAAVYRTALRQKARSMIKR